MKSRVKKFIDTDSNPSIFTGYNFYARLNILIKEHERFFIISV